MFKRYLILVFLVLFSACAGSKKVVTETKEKVRTLTITNEVKLDTTIFIPEEKVSLFIPIKEVKQKLKEKKPVVFTQNKGRARVTVQIDSLGIKATSNCDSIAQKLNFYKKSIQEMTKIVREIKSKKTEKKGYSFFELILYIIATAVVLFAAAYLLKTFKLL